MIIGIVIGVTIILSCLCIGICFCCKKKRWKRSHSTRSISSSCSKSHLSASKAGSHRYDTKLLYQITQFPDIRFKYEFESSRLMYSIIPFRSSHHSVIDGRHSSCAQLSIPRTSISRHSDRSSHRGALN